MVFEYGIINVIKYQNLTYVNVKPVLLCMRRFELMISAAVKRWYDHDHVYSDIKEQDLSAYFCRECK